MNNVHIAKYQNIKYEFLSLVITKLLLLSHSKVRFYKYFNSKFFNLGQCVEIYIAPLYTNMSQRTFLVNHVHFEIRFQIRLETHTLKLKFVLI